MTAGERRGVKEYPRIFRGDMVSAILEGRKTQTRVFADDRRFKDIQPGDRLWVRETWYCAGVDESDGYPVRYREGATVQEDVSISWRPSIFMPRWASRITLEITGVRVERLQDITEEDAKEEGVPPMIFSDGGYGKPDYRDGFRQLWDSINAKRGFGWDVNPWVWVIEFRRVTP